MGQNLLNKTNRILGETLADFDSGLEYVEATQRVMGFVISSDFKGSDHGKRQALRKKVLAAELSPQEMQRVGQIVTMNPVEAQLHHELEQE